MFSKHVFHPAREGYEDSHCVRKTKDVLNSCVYVRPIMTPDTEHDDNHDSQNNNANEYDSDRNNDNDNDNDKDGDRQSDRDRPSSYKQMRVCVC